ncbi:hypothetical protein [Bacillus taeanensis]|uniref:hypothetical protein n=1 Tax=Bacillus taeanensis TaxID=273032 RepID=UPI0015F0909C|nr:hypothetical protein [Bacillus taeanensis]
MEFVLFTMEEAEEIIQKRVNEILKNNDTINFEKLPGLIEALKIITDYKETGK